MARRGIEPRSSCSTSQELNHSATAAPKKSIHLVTCTSMYYRYIDRYRNNRYTGITLSSVYTPLKSRISGINILCILRFGKNCTRENKDTTFDHKIAKFDTRENFRLYGIMENTLTNFFQLSFIHVPLEVLEGGCESHVAWG